jgi:hypothetical protein
LHVEQVLGDVPREERCACRDQAKKSADDDLSLPSLMRRLFGG